MAKAVDIMTRTGSRSKRKRKSEMDEEQLQEETIEKRVPLPVLSVEPTTTVRWHGDDYVLLRGQKWDWFFEPGDNYVPTRVWRALYRESNGVRTLVAACKLQEVTD